MSFVETLGLSGFFGLVVWIILRLIYKIRNPETVNDEYLGKTKKK